MSNVKEMKVEMDFADRLAEKIYGEPRLDQMDCAKLIREALASRPVSGGMKRYLYDTVIKVIREEDGSATGNRILEVFRFGNQMGDEEAQDRIGNLTVEALNAFSRPVSGEGEDRIKLLEATLNLIANPELQNDYTPQRLARHALRIEPLLPVENTQSKGEKP